MKDFSFKNNKKIALVTVVIILVVGFFAFPKNLLIARTLMCNKGISSAHICNGFDKPYVLEGYDIVTREMIKDAGTRRYSLLTGNVIEVCGFWHGFEHGSYCDTGRSRKDVQGIK